MTWSPEISVSIGVTLVYFLFKNARGTS
jgi:hypothetical protein